MPAPALISPALVERVYSLWDGMVAQATPDTDHAMYTLLKEMCALLPADTALCMVAVRMQSTDVDEPTRGWRPRHVMYLDREGEAQPSTGRVTSRFDYGLGDITVRNNIAGAGTWRARRLCELAPPEWFESDFYHDFYTDMGRSDALWVGCPVNPDIEVYLGLFQGDGQSRFEPQQSDLALFAVRGLGWFLQRYLLSLGLDLASAPLTDTERAVLHLLLHGKAQKAIAAELSQSVHTTREHVQAIYHKFNVNSRAALMSLWLS